MVYMYVLLIKMTSFSGASCVLFSFVMVIFIALSPPSLGFLHNDFLNFELQFQQGFFSSVNCVKIIMQNYR